MVQFSNPHHLLSRFLLAGAFLSCGLGAAQAEFDVSTIRDARYVCVKGRYFSLHRKPISFAGIWCDFMRKIQEVGVFKEGGLVRGNILLWDSDKKEFDMKLGLTYNKVGEVFAVLDGSSGSEASDSQVLLNFQQRAFVEISNPGGSPGKKWWPVPDVGKSGFENPVIIRNDITDALKGAGSDLQHTQLVRGQVGNLIDYSDCEYNTQIPCAVVEGLRKTSVRVRPRDYAVVSKPPVGMGKKIALAVPLRITKNRSGKCTAVRTHAAAAALVQKEWRQNGFISGELDTGRYIFGWKHRVQMRVNSSIVLLPPRSPGEKSHKVVLSELENCDPSAPYKSGFFILDVDDRKVGIISVDRPKRSDFLASNDGMLNFEGDLIRAGFDEGVASRAPFWASASKSLPTAYNR